MHKFVSYFLLFSYSIVSAHALELQVGKGTFNWKMGVEKLTSANVDLDITTLSIIERYQPIPKTNLFYFFDATLYASNSVDAMTNLMSYPITYDFAISGSLNDAIEAYTPIPTPSSYEMRGLDLDIGLGHTLYKTDKLLMGLGLSTGFSMPVIKMKSLQKTIDFTYDLLESTQSSIKTYKFGSTAQIIYTPIPNILSFASLGLGYQTGSFENDWFNGSMDADGTYRKIDLGLSYKPVTSIADLSFTLGYKVGDWQVNTMKADLFDIFQTQSYGLVDTSFTSRVVYVGVGISF